MTSSTNSSSQQMLSTLKTTTLLLLFLSCYIKSTNATKHSFATFRDHRTFIGPMGTPFGFLENGEYELIVSAFELKIKNPHRKRNKNKKTNINNEEENPDDAILKELHPGFLLKRFSTENEFAYFQEEIYDNVTKCGFEDFIHGGEFAEDDDNLIGLTELDTPDYSVGGDVTDPNYDSKLATGKGVIDGGGDAGIFLSMKNKEHMWYPNTPSVKHTFTIDEAGFYFLFYQICLPVLNKDGKNSVSGATGDISKFAFKEISSRFIVDFHYTNIDTFGKISYLTAGEMPLPHMYLYFTISYTILLIMWLQSFKGDGTNESGYKPTIYAIHHLMSSVVVLKVLTMFFESVRYHFIRVSGHAEVWSFAYYFVNFFKGTFLFTVILLIGSGWSFFKPYLSTKERRVILFVIFLQVIDNIALAFLSHTSENERLYNDWSVILHLVDIVSCCAILVPIVWQVSSLEESVEVGSGSDENSEQTNANDVETSPTVETAPSSKLQSKLELFRAFYLIVVAYIYFTRIVIYLFASSLKYDKTWIRYLVYELGTLVFYFSVGIKFKPVVEVHSYSQLQTLPGDDDVNDTSGGQQQTQQIELSTVLGGKVAKD